MEDYICPICGRVMEREYDNNLKEVLKSQCTLMSTRKE